MNRILHIPNFYAPNKGGIESICQYIIENLPSFEHQVICFCRGAVRSILLVSKVPFERIRAVAADSSSRTSVALARIILARRYGVDPDFLSHPPALEAMLEAADAALIIGDPALRIDPAALPWRTLDLGAEWWELTGLPMVFAIWAARPGYGSPELAEAFLDSLRFGLERLEEIVAREAASRGFEQSLVRDYFTRNVVLELGEGERLGLERFLDYARQLGILTRPLGHSRA